MILKKYSTAPGRWVERRWVERRWVERMACRQMAASTQDAACRGEVRACFTPRAALGILCRLLAATVRLRGMGRMLEWPAWQSAS
ncbi:MAG: hypothetical protein WD872_07500 [Pirellulaceae bacterium]